MAITFSPNPLEVNKYNQTQLVTFLTDNDVSTIIKSSGDSWISLSDYNIKDQIITLSIAENTTGSPRTGSITFRFRYIGMTYEDATLDVTQTGLSTFNVTVSSTSFNVGYLDSDQYTSYNVTSGTLKDITVGSTIPEMIESVTPSYSGERVNYSIYGNPFAVSRTGSLTLKFNSIDNQSVTKVIDFTQGANNSDTKVNTNFSPRSLDLTYNQTDTQSITTANSNFLYHHPITSVIGKPNWITIESIDVDPVNKPTKDIIKLKASTNTSESRRSGDVVVRFKVPETRVGDSSTYHYYKGTINASFPLSQSGQTIPTADRLEVTLNPDLINFGEASGTESVSYTVNKGSLSSVGLGPTPDWITATINQSNNTVSISVSKNTTGSARRESVQVIFRDANYNTDVYETLTINQSASSLEPFNIKFSINPYITNNKADTFNIRYDIVSGKSSGYSIVDSNVRGNISRLLDGQIYSTYGFVTVVMNANTTGADYTSTADIAFTDTNYNVKRTFTLTIIQTGDTPTDDFAVTITPDSAKFEKEGGTQSVSYTVNKGTLASATVIEKPEWVTVSIDQSSKTISLTSAGAQGTGPIGKYVKIKFVSTGGTGLIKNIKIIQKGTGPSADSLIISYNNPVLQIPYSAIRSSNPYLIVQGSTSEYEVVSHPDWCTSVTVDLALSTVNIVSTINTEYVERSGTISIKFKDDSTNDFKTFDFTIKQDGYGTVTVNSLSLVFDNQTITGIADSNTVLNGYNIISGATSKVGTITKPDYVTVIPNLIDKYISVEFSANTTAYYREGYVNIQFYDDNLRDYKTYGFGIRQAPTREFSTVELPIWKDTDYNIDNPTNYTIRDENSNVLYEGRAIDNIRTNNILRNYLRSNLFENGSDNVYSHNNSDRSFSLYNSLTGLKMIQYNTHTDYSYNSLDWKGNIILSEPINYKYDIRSYSLFSVYNITTSVYNINGLSVTLGTTPRQTVRRRGSITVTRNGVNVFSINKLVCGKGALYYKNRFGGYDSFVIEGNIKKTLNVNRGTYNKIFNNNYPTEFNKVNYNKELTYSYTAVTNWLTDSESNRLVNNLICSPEVYYHDFDTDTIRSVVITLKNSEYKQFINGKKKVNYTLSFEESQYKLFD